MNENIFAFLPLSSYEPHNEPMLPMAKSLFYSEGQEDQFLFDERNYDLTENIFPEQKEPLKPFNNALSYDGGDFSRKYLEEQLEEEEKEEEEEEEEKNHLKGLNVLALEKEISYKSIDYEALDLELLKQKSHISQINQKMIKKHRSFKIKSKNEDKKNIHRYMIRQVIRSLASEDFKAKVLELCQKYQCEYQVVKESYLAQIESFTSIRLLSEHWSINPFDESVENKNRMVFREFSKWFLKERAIRYILNGKMKDPLKYIQYKNHIMLYYVEKPQEYKSNNKKKC